MKKTLFIIFTIIFSLNIQAQHTERFLELTKPLKAIDSTTIIRKYKNGNPKEITKYLQYEYGDYIYDFFNGKYQIFDKNGIVFYEEEFDRFGNILKGIQINENGEIFKEIVTEKIDVKTESIEKFLNSRKTVIITAYEKEYSSTEKNGELFLWKEGKRVNGKKIGVWKTYNGCDDTIKIKDYSKK